MSLATQKATIDIITMIWIEIIDHLVVIDVFTEVVAIGAVIVSICETILITY
jgi:hypothetical protein|tara:strand:+ start:300 stop:455 length:156 start_codon:yes stop_codon:yes gene_type:complete